MALGDVLSRLTGTLSTFGLLIGVPACAALYEVALIKVGDVLSMIAESVLTVVALSGLLAAGGVGEKALQCP